MKRPTLFSQIAALPARDFLPLLLLMLAVFAAYGNVYDNAFLFDDDLLITLNTFLRQPDQLWNLLTGSTTGGAHIAGGFYRPMQGLLYFVTYQLADAQTKIGFHLLNVAIHATNACLGFTLARRLGFRPGPAFLAVLLWALHPLHTEAVTYMSGTADPLFVLFDLAALLVMAPDFAPRRILLALPFFVLGLLSKETATVLPLLTGACLFLRYPAARWQPRLYLRLWPLLLLAGVYLSWRMNTLAFDGPATYARIYQLPDFANLKHYAENPLWRVCTFFATLPCYLGLLVWPVDLHMERSFTIYSSPLSWLVAAGALMLLAAATQVGFNKNARTQPLNWGLLWFASAHLPDSGLGVAVNSLFLEHWMYLPTLGLFLGGAESCNLWLRGLEQRRRWQAVGTCLALVAAAALGLRSWDQNRIWHDPVVFYNNIFDHGEVSARARNNLALAYMDRHDYAQAISQFNQAIAITDTYAETRYNLALALLSLPDQPAHLVDAIDQLQHALQIDRHFYRADDALAKIYAAQGKADEAAYYRQQTEQALQAPH